ncbi:Photosystem I reaction center subunit IV A chloroplastic [Bienertia sinuspersici]
MATCNMAISAASGLGLKVSDLSVKPSNGPRRLMVWAADEAAASSPPPAATEEPKAEGQVPPAKPPPIGPKRGSKGVLFVVVDSSGFRVMDVVGWVVFLGCGGVELGGFGMSCGQGGFGWVLGGLGWVGHGGWTVSSDQNLVGLVDGGGGGGGGGGGVGLKLRRSVGGVNGLRVGLWWVSSGGVMGGDGGGGESRGGGIR